MQEPGGGIVLMDVKTWWPPRATAPYPEESESLGQGGLHRAGEGATPWSRQLHLDQPQQTDIAEMRHPPLARRKEGGLSRKIESAPGRFRSSLQWRAPLFRLARVTDDRGLVWRTTTATIGARLDGL